MSGNNYSILNIPPGIHRETSKYAAGMKWWNGNLVRWIENVLIPVGGWVKQIAGLGTSNEPIRAAFSWRDNDFVPWAAMGSADLAHAVKITDQPFQTYDITPPDLAWSPGTKVGFGAGSFGSGAFGKDAPDGNVSVNPDAFWTFDNWGEDLVAVHSTDGRLMRWSPTAPTGKLAQVAAAPADNRLVIVTNERHVMLLGGKNNPRRVKWCSQEDIDDWTATATNTAGGFELNTQGSIIGCAKINAGIIVWTDMDVHLIEYAGTPDIYVRRVISDVTGIVGPKAWAPIPNGVVWCGISNYWMFDGSVTKIECDIRSEVFGNGYLSRQVAVHMGANDTAQEVWTFYPTKGATEPNRLAIFSYAQSRWWSMGILSRTAWMNPVWQQRPWAMLARDVYEHELGWLADGVSRTDIYAETGAIEIGEGDRVVRADRVIHDAVDNSLVPYSTPPVPYNVTFDLAQAPDAPHRTYGPITLNSAKGYTTIRFRARQVSMKVAQVVDGFWGMGKLRVRVKPGGGR